MNIVSSFYVQREPRSSLNLMILSRGGGKRIIVMNY